MANISNVYIAAKQNSIRPKGEEKNTFERAINEENKFATSEIVTIKAHQSLGKQINGN